MDMATVRRCSRCGREKSIRSFGHSASGGRAPNCRACVRPHGTVSDEERFWAYVNKDGPVLVPELGPCWVWTGCAIRGYGRVRFLGKPEYSHRVAWYLEHGRWPDPQALHRCDGGALGCVRVAHLFEGTTADNMLDKVQKGRQRRGAAVPNAKLTEPLVRQIRESVQRGETHRVVASRLGISPRLVAMVALCQIWKHVE